MTGRPTDDVVAVLAAALRGWDLGWPIRRDQAGCIALMKQARLHGVAPVLHAVVNKGAPLHSWPAAVFDALQTEAASEAVRSVLTQREIRRVLATLSDAGVASLLLKGAAFAYTLYSHPSHRPRGDTDVLVANSDVAVATRVLKELGYSTQSQEASGSLLQSSWEICDATGLSHSIDLHWRISNSPLLARAFTHEELVRRSRLLSALGDSVRSLSTVDALLFACVHRAGHRHTACRTTDAVFVGGDRLIWLYDIQLLVASLSRDEEKLFIELAERKELKAICLEGLRAASECLGFEIPEVLQRGLTPRGEFEPTARYLGGSRARQMLGDLLAIEGWSARIRWLRQLGFPRSEYMRHKYSESGMQWLPLLYAHRAARGVWRTLGHE